jgi:CubicO group peptidase (beta-lactamase class C family)
VGALDTIADWPVDHAAAAVVGVGDRRTAGATDRVFALASVTKLLSAYAALVAVEEGTLDLDQPAGPPGSTVRHLLAHASGLGFDTGVLVAPERKRIYSNTGFEVLGDHLAAQAGMPFGRYLHEAVIGPLAMDATDLGDRSPAHGARSSAEDLARFAAELLTPTLIARDTLELATTVHFPGLDGVLPGFGAQHPNDWGLGFELRDHKSPHWTGDTCSAGTYGHFGAAGTFLWVDPDVGVALVALTDRPFGPWAAETWPALADAVLAAT